MHFNEGRVRIVVMPTVKSNSIERDRQTVDIPQLNHTFLRQPSNSNPWSLQQPQQQTFSLGISMLAAAALACQEVHESILHPLARVRQLNSLLAVMQFETNECNNNWFKHQTESGMSLTKMKAETESRMSEEKKITERKRNLIVLIEKYLLTLGYIDAVTKIQQESNITLEKWDTADNIDLYMVMLEYEQSYEMKFNKMPKLVKKVDNPANYEQLKRAAMKQKQINASINKNEDNSSARMPPSKPNFKKNSLASEKGEKKDDKKDQANSTGGFEVQGTNMGGKKKDDDDDDLFDIRVLKGIPDYTDVPEYRELANYLQRDILVENPNIRFSDIVGLEDAKRLLKEAVSLPLKYPHLFTGILEPWRGVLLFGPPGTGKTMLAKSVATQCKTTFFNISASSVVSKWRGESEKLIRVLFELARFYQPSTIFIDQIDSIMSQRSGSGAEHEGSRRMKTQLLIQMDGIVKKKENVFILAASNLPWDLDIAMLRRLEKRILVDLPCLEAREAMMRMHLPPERAENIDYPKAAEMLQGYSGSDIKLVCKEAAMKPLRRLLFKLQEIELKEQQMRNKKMHLNKEDIPQPEKVTMEDVLAALQTTKCSPGLITERYKKWVQDFGSL